MDKTLSPLRRPPAPPGTPISLGARTAESAVRKECLSREGPWLGDAILARIDSCWLIRRIRTPF